MWPPTVVEVQILSDGSARFGHVGVGLQVDLLVFDALPDALDEDVVAPGALAIHADPDAVGDQQAGEGGAGELGGFNRLSQQLIGGVAMAVQIRRSDRIVRDGLRSPGRPKAVRRDDERRFWE